MKMVVQAWCKAVAQMLLQLTLDSPQAGFSRNSLCERQVHALCSWDAQVASGGQWHCCFCSRHLSRHMKGTAIVSGGNRFGQIGL